MDPKNFTCLCNLSITGNRKSGEKEKCPEVLIFCERQSTDRWLTDWGKMYLHKEFGELVFSHSIKRNKILTLGDGH